MTYDAMVGGATMIIFNGSIVALLRVTLRDADFSQALTEKNATGPQGTQGSAPLSSVMGGAASSPATDGSGNPTSYSRVAGMTGAVVLACFLWALGNAVLYRIFHAPADVSSLITSTAEFFLVGSAMFLPYAFNQIKAAFS
jgi:hypothetical protein